MSKKALHLVFCLTLLFAFSTVLPVRARQSYSAYDLIDAVNALRASNGLSPYKVNSLLMNSAQRHSDYQASIGEVTHTGAGGTRPYDRALAAGYGGGGTIIISENIAGGTNISAEAAVSLWQGDDPHLGTMLGANYRDVGAGMAVSNNFVYFTLDAAYVAGGGSNLLAPTLQGTPPSTLPATAVTFVVPVKIATPGPDGSIIHVVEYGQTLYAIADAYKVSLDQLKALNKLSTTTIYVGEKLIIQTSYTPTPVGLAKTTLPPQTPTLRPTRTAKPFTATPLATSVGTATLLPSPTVNSPARSSLGNDPLLVLIIIVAAAGLLMMVAGSLLKRSSS